MFTRIRRELTKRREARRLGCDISELEWRSDGLYVAGTGFPGIRARDVNSLMEARLQREYEIQSVEYTCFG